MANIRVPGFGRVPSGCTRLWPILINKGGHLATLLVPVVYRYHRGYCTPRGRTFEARLLHNKTTVVLKKVALERSRR